MWGNGPKPVIATTREKIDGFQEQSFWPVTMGYSSTGYGPLVVGPPLLSGTAASTGVTASVPVVVLVVVVGSITTLERVISSPL